jgi:LPXTG-motif cell wall-anchored protein
MASVAVVPGIAGAATNCPTTAGSTATPSMTPPTPNCPVVVPVVSANQTPLATSSLPNTGATSGSPAAAGTSGSSSLPFTGADVEELAVIGGVALLAGGLLMRRRRTVQA